MQKTSQPLLAGTFLLTGSNIVQVGILTGDILDAGTRLHGVQVVVAYNHGAGVTPVEVFKQLSHGSLLFSRSRVGGLTALVL